MSTWARRLVYALASAALLAALWPGCVRLADERAELDERVGRAAADGVDFEVTGGLATVHDVGSGRLELWAQAPTLELVARAGFDGEGRWRLTLKNAMPDAELTEISESGLIVVSREQPDPTTIVWTLDFQAGQSTRMRIAPPDSDTAEPYRFAVLSDVQDAVIFVDDIWEGVNADPTLRFVVSTGDITDDGTMRQLRFFMDTLDELDIPLFTTVGNHEVGPADPQGFNALYGRASFQFRFKKTWFTFVDTAAATIDPLVYDWLEAWLELAEDDLHVFVTHIPPIDPAGIRNASFRSRNEAHKLLSMLADGGVDLGLYGHLHSYYADADAGIPVYISGGGGGSPEQFDGIDRHYLVVEARPGEGIAEVGVVRVD
jgi:3',5'-cyclic-AMP phosphodiesterase